jgi:hypothetical protein
MVNVQYSILCHYPSIVSVDCITLGVLIYNKDDQTIVFERIKNWQRVKSFNDELDINLTKLQLDGIEEEVGEFCKKASFDLSEYTKYYIGEIKFTDVANVVVEDFDKFVTECRKQYLICDLDKKDRPSKSEQLEFIRNTFKNSAINYKSGKIIGYFDENVNFDFIINGYAIKIFSFDGKKEKRLIKCVKDWAYDAYKLKDKYKIVFVTDINPEYRKDYRTVCRILQEECYKIISLQDLMPFVTKLNSKTNSAKLHQN